jgi:hypothetical protein
MLLLRGAVGILSAMPSEPRYVEPNSVLEITVRTFQGRYLLRPSRRANELIRGVLARALQLSPGISLHLDFVLSTHITLILTASDVVELARFMSHLLRNISDEMGRLHNWPGALWERPYVNIACVDEEAQIRRMAYVLAQGTKDGLVRRVMDWPGVHGAGALISTMRARGTWVNRTKAYRMRSKGKKVSNAEVEETLEIRYAQLPAWADLSLADYQKKVRQLIRKVEARSRELHHHVLGKDKIVRQDPHARSRSLIRRPKPACHATTSDARVRFLGAKSAFIEAYRQVFSAWSGSMLNLNVPCFAPSMSLREA